MDELLPKALPVDGGEVEENVAAAAKWDLPAQSAASYLKMVRQEASKCPEIVIAENLDPSKLNSSQTYFVTADSPLLAPLGFEPSIQWQIKQILEFSKLREKISKMKDTYRKSKEDCPRFPPDMTDGQRWVVWCCGKEVLANSSYVDNDDEDEADDDESDDDDDGDEKDAAADGDDSRGSSGGNLLKSNDSVSAIFSQLEGEEKPSTSSVTAAAATKKVELAQGNPPLMSVTMHMNQPMIETVLKHHYNHMRDKGFHIQQGPWIYALLALLQKPLTPDMCSTLRDLARLCSQMRVRLDCASHPHLRPFNLFISLVARYFDQRDMADGFNGAVQ